MRILFFGDLVGRPGLKALASLLPKLAQDYEADFIIANGENVSNGRGIIERDYNELVEAGVDAITLGNHWEDKKQVRDYIDDVDRLIRPLNVLDFDGGVGTAVFDVDGISIRVTNLLGQAFMKENVANPYGAMLECIANEEKADIHIVDFHAESTSEKQILAHALDGKISALIGTHTHVQTNDAIILKNGTGYLSDAGMSGARDSIIGFSSDSVIKKMLFNEEGKFRIDEDVETCVDFVYLDINESNGKCEVIRPIRYINGRLFDGEASN